jgi:excisionase family DNA binding protein
MRVKEVAHELGQHPATIYRKVNDGSLPVVRLGDGPRAPIRIDSGELDAWLESRHLERKCSRSPSARTRRR